MQYQQLRNGVMISRPDGFSSYAQAIARAFICQENEAAAASLPRARRHWLPDVLHLANTCFKGQKMLIVFSGLPGTGKTTIAQQLVATTSCVYLRIDTIEQALRNSGTLAQGVGRSGYEVANALALSNLRLGKTVIADCVNPVTERRAAWRETASTASVQLLNVEVICSDADEHRRRVESRRGDIPGLTPPTWQSVLAHEYEPWAEARVCIDTAMVSAAQAVSLIMEFAYR